MGATRTRRVVRSASSPGIGAISQGLADDFAPISIEDWTTYSPTFGQYGGTTATLGDGSLTGTYNRIGDLVNFRLSFVWGASTSCDGFFLFGLPVPMVAGTAQNYPINGWCYLEDLSTAAFMGWPRFQSASGAFDILPAGAAGAAGNPFGPADGRWTWAAGDFVNMSGGYRCAP